MNKRKMSGIPRADVPAHTGGKKLPQVDVSGIVEGKITFSYNFLDLQHELFNCGGTEANWFVHLHKNLREISRNTKREFINQMRQHFDVHGHDFDNLAHRYQLPGDMLQQVEADCIQFRLSSSGGRVHGFFIESTFYVVWLDPHHNLYPSQRHGGEKFFDKHLTPYEELQNSYAKLQQEYDELFGVWANMESQTK